MVPEDAPTFAGWEVLEKLGEGGMCSVWRVRPSAGDGPERAIKVLHDPADGAATRFSDEARLLQRIHHPNVLKIHALHDEARPPWIVMDLLAGKDLEETREQHRGMEPEQAARLFADVASGLARVHALGVRHRDIKPANIMLGHDGVPRLIDFGIARETSRAHVTQQGLVVGTASYLPPEIFVEDDAHAIQDSEAADVYALGQSMCEVLTGTPIHSRGGPGSNATMLVTIMKDKMDRPHLDPRQWRPVPDDLAEIVMGATKQEPEERIRTARELEARLRGWLKQRHAADQAPLTAVDPAALPPPPTSRVKPSMTPEPASERAHATATASAPGVPRTVRPVPPRRSARATAAVSAAGFGLVGILAAGIAALTLAGALAIAMLGPRVPAASASTIASIRTVTDPVRSSLARCAQAETRADVTVTFAVASGRVSGVRVQGEVADAVERCLVQHVEGLEFPGTTRANVHLPISFQ